MTITFTRECCGLSLKGQFTCGYLLTWVFVVNTGPQLGKRDKFITDSRSTDDLMNISAGNFSEWKICWISYLWITSIEGEVTQRKGLWPWNLLISRQKNKLCGAVDIARRECSSCLPNDSLESIFWTIPIRTQKHTYCSRWGVGYIPVSYLPTRERPQLKGANGL